MRSSIKIDLISELEKIGFITFYQNNRKKITIEKDQISGKQIIKYGKLVIETYIEVD